MTKDKKHEKKHKHTEDEAQAVVEEIGTEGEQPQKDTDKEQQEAKPEQLDEQQQDYLNQMLRIQAEFDNYRKRINRERDEFRKYAGEQVLLDLLPIIDNFRLALSSLEEHVIPENHKFFEGVEMIYRQLGQMLEKNGVQELETVGKPFDPCYHNALQQIESTDVPENHVAQEVSKGYMMHGKLLRPAAVIVAKEPSGQQAE